MATIALEMINPYSKFGLKRRPTFDEIANLVKENDTITGTLPNRDATFFKASPEGSFFDGMDAMELLKEQQNRIMERQMRDIMLRRHAMNTGVSYNVARLQEQSRETTPAEAEVFEDHDRHSASVQAELEARARQAVSRQQQTGEAHSQGGFLGGRITPMLEGIFNIGTPTLSRSSSRVEPPLVQASPQRPPPGGMFVIGGDTPSDTADEMMTARGEPEEDKETKLPTNLKTITYSTNVGSMTEEALKFQLFLRGVDVNAPEMELQTRKKGKGSGKTTKQYYLDIANSLVANGRWQEKNDVDVIQQKVKEYKNLSRSSTG